MLTLPPDQAFEFYRTFLEWYAGWFHPSYLEVGCADGSLTRRLAPVTQRTVGIDVVQHVMWDEWRRQCPNTEFICMSSDDYFKDCNDSFGLIFVDADHSSAQVIQDTYSALGHLQPGGLIVLHDTYPPDTEHTDPGLCGTAYRAAQLLRQRSGQDGLEVYTFPVTFGVTLIGKVGTQFPWID
jgi:SAM-dependent methyltransferase